jgi:serine/threonine protein kinase
MSLPPGTKLGPYEITGTLGAGGMGEVYRAHDTKLNREVAIKVVPETLAADPAALERFQREAQAVAALSHPNILAIFDFGVEGSTPYAVMELLEGQSLRGALAEGALPVRKALDYALQIAAGLAAAHARGITHRDLKPENVFVTKDGRVKILDFGLARVDEPEATGSGQSFTPTKSVTAPGSVLGTVGYMAPEQVRGQAVDTRANIFALGAILYELLAGQRAFSGPSAVETLNAILKEDPPELTRANALLPPALDRIVRRCLEKSPDERFQSARDLAFALEAISGAGSGSMAPIAAPVKAPRKIRKLVLTAIGALGLISAGIGIGWILVPRPAALSSLRLTRLTFDRGLVSTARFSPDGKTVIYDGEWNGLPPQIFQTRLGNQQSNPLPMPSAYLTSISSEQDMAILLEQHGVPGFTTEGTLAEVPVVGGTPKPVQPGIRSADYSPDGKQLAIVRRVQNKDQLEYPKGHALTETETTGYISNPRISPQGDAVAYLEHPRLGDNRGYVALVSTTDGKKKLFPEDWSGVTGLAWSPDAKEIWFTASEGNGPWALRSVTRRGAVREIWSDTTNLVIHDTFPDGRALMTTNTIRDDIYWLGPGEARERNMSWLGWSGLEGVSADGLTLLMCRFDEGAGPDYEIGLRRVNELAGVSLGRGQALQLSPDGKWALAIVPSGATRLILLATGTDESRNLTTPGFRYLTAGWFPDGKRILFSAEEAKQAPSTYIQDLAGGSPQRIPGSNAPFDFERGLLVSPDGKWFTGAQMEGPPILLPIAGGEPQKMRGLDEQDVPVAWSTDGRSLYINRDGSDRFGTLIAKYELDAGHVTPIKSVQPADLAGIGHRPYCRITPDGRTVAYAVFRRLTDLYLVEGLK